MGFETWQKHHKAPHYNVTIRLQHLGTVWSTLKQLLISQAQHRLS